MAIWISGGRNYEVWMRVDTWRVAYRASKAGLIHYIEVDDFFWSEKSRIPNDKKAEKCLPSACFIC